MLHMAMFTVAIIDARAKLNPGDLKQNPTKIKKSAEKKCIAVDIDMPNVWGRSREREAEELRLHGSICHNCAFYLHTA